MKQQDLAHGAAMSAAIGDLACICRKSALLKKWQFRHDAAFFSELPSRRKIQRLINSGLGLAVA